MDKISEGSVHWFWRNRGASPKKRCFEKNAFKVFFNKKSLKNLTYTYNIYTYNIYIHIHINSKNVKKKSIFPKWPTRIHPEATFYLEDICYAFRCEKTLHLLRLSTNWPIFWCPQKTGNASRPRHETSTEINSSRTARCQESMTGGVKFQALHTRLGQIFLAASLSLKSKSPLLNRRNQFLTVWTVRVWLLYASTIERWHPAADFFKWKQKRMASCKLRFVGSNSGIIEAQK